MNDSLVLVRESGPRVTAEPPINLLARVSRRSRARLGEAMMLAVGSRHLRGVRRGQRPPAVVTSVRGSVVAAVWCCVALLATGCDSCAVGPKRYAGQSIEVAGSPPDIAMIPQPGVLAQYAATGAAKPITGALADSVR